MGVGTSVPKWRASKLVKTSMVNDMVCTLMKVRENLPLGKSMRFNEPYK